MVEKTLHPTYCQCRNPQSITGFIALHIIQHKLIYKTNRSIQIQEDKSKYTNRSTQIQIENLNSMTKKILWQIQVVTNNYQKTNT